MPDEPTKRKSIEAVLSEFGCSGPCAHGPCCVEKTCDDPGCHLKDVDDWCLVCRIQDILGVES
jgi:hypothetical protein